MRKMYFPHVIHDQGDGGERGNCSGVVSDARVEPAHSSTEIFGNVSVCILVVFRFLYEHGMSRRIDKSWLVFISIENADHDRCVDLFSRPDGTYGFEEFRRDVEDRGEWTPVRYYSGSLYSSGKSALEAAMESVVWLKDAIQHTPSAQRLLSKNSD